MKLPRRNFLHLAAGAAALPAVSRIASAQAYPTRPVRIIVGFAPSGATDIMARLIGQWLSERLGQQFAASNIGTKAVVNAPPVRGGPVQAPLRFARAGTHKPRSSILLRIEDARTALLYRTGNCSRPQQASRFRMRAARYEKGGCEKPHGTLR